jgi:hypothetical protein
LKQEEKRLGRMEKRLGGLQSDLEQTASTATSLFGFLGFGGGGGTAGAEGAAKGSAPTTAKKPGRGTSGEGLCFVRC